MCHWFPPYLEGWKQTADPRVGRKLQLEVPISSYYWMTVFSHWWIWPNLIHTEMRTQNLDSMFKKLPSVLILIIANQILNDSHVVLKNTTDFYVDS